MTIQTNTRWDIVLGLVTFSPTDLKSNICYIIKQLEIQLNPMSNTECLTGTQQGGTLLGLKHLV